MNLFIIKLEIDSKQSEDGAIILDKRKKTTGNFCHRYFLVFLSYCSTLYLKLFCFMTVL